MSRLAALALLVPSLAVADDPIVSNEVIEVKSAAPTYAVSGLNATAITTRSERSASQGWLLLPAGQEFGAELRLLTSPRDLGGAPLAFTDVALLTLRGRTVLGKRAELFGTVDVLPKQPSTTDELVWQGATLGLNVQPWDRPLALSARTTGGVLLDRAGYWGQGAVGATARKVLHEIMTFEGGPSVLATRLAPAADAQRGWLVEAALAGSVVFHDPQGWTGGWFGFNYALPVAHDGAMIDPQPRLDLELGVVLSFVDHWDVFARFEIIDRGDPTAMATQLPILDGGFDQRQVVVGVTYHTRSKSD